MTTNVEIEETSIEDKLDSLHYLTPNPCIRKVPEFMASVPIEPLVVSIGPLYCHKEALKPFQEMKLRHLQSLLQEADGGFDLGQYVDIIRENEHEFRSHYSEKSSLSSYRFIEMILIDAAFIIFFFIMSTELCHCLGSKHPIRNRIEVLAKVNHDLFLVENQLPFFVLNDLFDKAFGVRFPDLTFKDVAFRFISCTSFPGREVALAVAEELRDTSNIKHLVDCLRICCLPSTLRCKQIPCDVDTSNIGNFVNCLRTCCLPDAQPSNEGPLNTEYALEFPKTAKKLKEVGVKFLASESKNLLDITFSEGVLQVPKLKIEDGTKAILRSMAFYEQCHHHCDSYLIDYLVFMNALIDTREDVQILVKKGIIKSLLGSDKEGATLFNDVNKDVLMNTRKFYYADLCKELDAYANTKCNHWKAVLRKDYFNHPWSIISLISAVLLLILTALQVYTGFKHN